MKILGQYKNGNYSVTLFDDGTKIRCNDEDELIPEKPESMDILITKRCGWGCPMCHEDATPNGKHGELLHLPFLDTLLPYTELAIGGGNPLCHPQLIPFLEQCREKKLIPNMTVHANDLILHADELEELTRYKLLFGLGVSVQQWDEGLLPYLKRFPNAVIHVINGVISIPDLQDMYDKDLKLLILGYKDFRRGVAAHSDVTDRRMKMLYTELPELVSRFKVVSFDNLSIEQLDPWRLLRAAEWNEIYMGDDGKYTMYVDLVNREFAKSSVSTERWPLLDDIKPMFDKVRESK